MDLLYKILKIREVWLIFIPFIHIYAERLYIIEDFKGNVDNDYQKTH